jgi:hypothetical protein
MAVASDEVTINDVGAKFISPATLQQPHPQWVSTVSVASDEDIHRRSAGSPEHIYAARSRPLRLGGHDLVVCDEFQM